MKIRKISSGTEQKIITGMITSTDFLIETSKILNLEYFKNDSLKTIAKWILNYLRDYNKAPVKDIQMLFDIEKDDLSEEDANLVEKTLINISDKFIKINNVPFLLDRTKKYFKRRNYEIFFEKGVKLKDLPIDKFIRKSEELEEKHKRVDFEVLSNKPEDIFSEEQVQDHFQAIKDKSNVLFSQPGALGYLMGEMQREWLVAFLGPMGRGKSWWLLDFALEGYYNGLNVIFISLEMNSLEIKERLYKMSSGMTTEEEIIFPVFDCLNNQDGSCTLNQRTNDVNLFDELGISEDKEIKRLLDFYDEDIDYSPCTECLKDKDLKDNYIQSLWKINKTPKQMEEEELIKKFKENKMYDFGELKYICYPAFSPSILDVDNLLEKEYMENNFIPDVIVIDHADNLRPINRGMDTRAQIDETWKHMKKMAQERKALVATASQSTRKTLDSSSVRSSDVSEDIRKLAHVNAMWSLNQTPYERDHGLMRFGELKARGKRMTNRQLIILQSLQAGQVMIDCDYYREYTPDFFEKK
jgi:hypothetical protein